MTERHTKTRQGAVAKPDYAPAKGENFAADSAPPEEFSLADGLRLSADRFKGEYAYVPLECPRCGLAGKIKISRLDRTFTCKQCKRVFHITVHGVVNGERPPPDALPDPEAPIQSQRANRLERWFSRLPPVVRWGIAGAIVGALPVMAMLIVKLQEDPFPEDLSQRAAIAGQAFAKGDWRTLDRLAMPDTSNALHQWFDKTPREAFAGLGADSDVKATVGKTTEMFRRAEKDEKGKNVLVADFRTPVEIHLAESPDGPTKVVVDFVWVENARGQWQIDGEWMLNFANKKTPAARADEEDEVASPNAGLPPGSVRRPTRREDRD
ncbi:MAG TPA: hypothetical protein VHC19_05110 [Pirellulales bacterium]|nr:hypothetical protein [Pirellulales bacterium]